LDIKKVGGFDGRSYFQIAYRRAICDLKIHGDRALRTSRRCEAVRNTVKEAALECG
jgi:hypothetical protein